VAARGTQTGAKTFSFPVSPDGSRTIPRVAITGLPGRHRPDQRAGHAPGNRAPARAQVLGFFISEIQTPDPAFVEGVAQVYLQNRTEIKPVIRYILTSPCSPIPRILRALCPGRW
jgi:hypothetical protein